MVGVAGLFAAQDYLDEKGVSNIYRHEMKLAKMLYQGLRPIKKIVLYNKPVMGTHIGMISFGIKGITPEKIGSILESKYGIYSRAGLHCAPLIHKHIGTITGGTVRLSIGPFNTATEIEKTILAISEIASQRQ
jgi:selenocysteine lyase/cysteine desulfurase